MNFPFDPKNMCKILAHNCNHQDYTHSNCPAKERQGCPFGKLTICEDVTWKDWRDFFKENKNHVEMDK